MCSLFIILVIIELKREALKATVLFELMALSVSMASTYLGVVLKL